MVQNLAETTSSIWRRFFAQLETQLANVIDHEHAAMQLVDERALHIERLEAHRSHTGWYQHSC